MSDKEKIFDREIRRVIDQLEKAFNRPPTEDEVYDFIYGDHARRMNILRYAPKET